MVSNFNLDKPLLEFTTSKAKSYWTVRDAVEGIQIFGGIGSGKTSGSGKTLASKFLKNQFGGLVLIAKEDEVDLWRSYCKETNRLADLIILEPDGKHRFNFLDYLASNPRKHISHTDNIIQVLKTVIEAGAEKDTGKNNDPFWESSLNELLSNAIELCQLAYDTISISDLYEIVSTAPRKDTPIKKSVGSYGHAMATVREKIEALIEKANQNLTPEQKNLFHHEHHREAFYRDQVPGYSAIKRIDNFFSESYLNISEKTRAIIEFSFTGFLSRLLKEPVHSLFCKGTSTVVPEDSLDGKIILINLPVKVFQKMGRDAQILIKYLWQLAMERRNVKQNGRPVFLWADEAQNFIHAHYSDFQATARSSRIITTYITQNLSNYHANMGGGKSEYRVQSFLATLGTQIFHNNTSVETNRYASQLIGQAYTQETQSSFTVSGGFQSSRSKSYKLEYMVRPEEFTGLRTGGPTNLFMTEAYVHLQSKKFPSGFNHKKVTFFQV